MRAKIIWAALAGLCVAAPAQAEDCKPLRLIASLPMTPVRDTNTVTVPVSINGVEKQFLVGSFGFTSQIAESIADELKIPQHQDSRELYSAGGYSTRGAAVIPDFAIGPVHAKDYDVSVAANMTVDGPLTIVGNRNFDFELDFAAKKLNMFLSDHCEGKVVYWPSKALGVVPFTTNGEIVVPVTIDGHELKAVINTTAFTSNIRMDRVESLFGLHPDSPGMTVTGHLGTNQQTLGTSPQTPIYSYSFKTLAIGNLVVSNPHIQIVTDVVTQELKNGIPGLGATKGNGETAFPEVNIAMDILSKLHIYLALREKKVYFTEASTPAASTAGPTPQSASTTQPQ